MREQRARSILKTISWRAIATITTVLLVYIATGEVGIALGVGGVELIAKLIFYYFHERIWNKIEWGHEKNQR